MSVASFRYRRLKAPLSLYFGVSGVAVGTAFLFWSLPLVIFDNTSLIRTMVVIGDVGLFFMLAIQAKILSYLTIPEKYHVFAVSAAAIVAVIGFVSSANATFTKKIGIIDGEVFLPTADISHLSQTVLLAVPLMIGLIFLSRSVFQKTVRNKLGLLGVGMLYALVAIAGLLNVTF